MNACVDDDDGFSYSKLSALLKGVKRAFGRERDSRESRIRETNVIWTQKLLNMNKYPHLHTAVKIDYKP